MKCDVCGTQYSPANNSGGNNSNDNSSILPGSVLAFPQDNVSNNGTRFNATGLAQGVYYAFGGSGAAGAKKLSFAISSGGYPVYVGFDLNAMQNDGVGGSNWHEAPTTNAWTFYVMFTADSGRVQDGHIDMLDA